MSEIKKRRKYQKGIVKPLLSMRINVRVTLEEYNSILKKAVASPEGNMSGYCRHKLLKGDKFISLDENERNLLMELVAARTDIKRFIVAVDATTRNLSDEMRKNYILSLGVQRMWAPAVNRVFSCIASFLEKYKYDMN